MVNKQRESWIERAVVNYARTKGVLVYKFQSPAQRGVPDRVFIYNGLVWFIEFKATGKKPTQQQSHHMTQIGIHGGYASWTDSFESGCAFIDSYMELADSQRRVNHDEKNPHI